MENKQNRDIRGNTVEPEVLQHIGRVTGLLAGRESQKAKRPQQDLEWQKQTKKRIKPGTFGFKSAEWNWQNKLDTEFQRTSLFFRYMPLVAYFLNSNLISEGVGIFYDTLESTKWNCFCQFHVVQPSIDFTVLLISPRSDRFGFKLWLSHIRALWILGQLTL